MIFCAFARWIKNTQSDHVLLFICCNYMSVMFVKSRLSLVCHVCHVCHVYHVESGVACASHVNESVSVNVCDASSSSLQEMRTLTVA